MDKMYKPGECMKYMNVEVHPTLLELWYCADITREVTSAGAKVVPSGDIYDNSLVMWSRNLQPTLASAGGQVSLTPTKESCDRALYVCTADIVAEYVNKRTLAQHIGLIKEMVGRTLTLVIFGVKNYFKGSSRKTNNSNHKLMNDIELEMAKTDLLVTADCDTVIANEPIDLALLIVQFTKAIAEKPFKLAKRAIDEQAEFYMRGDNKNTISLSKDGTGTHRVWQQMVGLMPLSSLETARALCAEYKTPRELYEALQKPDSVGEVAAVSVTRSAVPGARARHVGPEFARKLHTLFTADEGNILLD